MRLVLILLSLAVVLVLSLTLLGGGDKKGAAPTPVQRVPQVRQQAGDIQRQLDTRERDALRRAEQADR